MSFSCAKYRRTKRREVSAKKIMWNCLIRTETPCKLIYLVNFGKNKTDILQFYVKLKTFKVSWFPTKFLGWRKFINYVIDFSVKLSIWFFFVKTTSFFVFSNPGFSWRFFERFELWLIILRITEIFRQNICFDLVFSKYYLLIFSTVWLIYWTRA